MSDEQPPRDVHRINLRNALVVEELDFDQGRLLAPLVWGLLTGGDDNTHVQSLIHAIADYKDGGSREALKDTLIDIGAAMRFDLDSAAVHQQLVGVRLGVGGTANAAAL